MEYLDHPFDVNTGSSRRPTPTTFVHLRKWVDKDEKFLELHSQTDITNINKQLDDSATFYVSNVIQRVIAQLIGETDKGMATIKATDDGQLKVYIDADAIAAIAALATTISLAAGSNLIGKVEIQGTSQLTLKAIIDFNLGDTYDIIGIPATGKRHNITSIVFVTGGTTNIILRDESGAFTGGMDFGGTDEPRGMVANHELHPLKCTINEKFQIVSSGDVQVSGYVLYFDA